MKTGSIRTGHKLSPVHCTVPTVCVEYTRYCNNVHTRYYCGKNFVHGTVRVRHINQSAVNSVACYFTHRGALAMAWTVSTAIYSRQISTLFFAQETFERRHNTTAWKTLLITTIFSKGCLTTVFAFGLRWRPSRLTNARSSASNAWARWSSSRP